MSAYARAMAWKKAPEALVAAFARTLPADATVERRSMFGFPCAFVGGNMVSGLFEERVFVRLDDAARDELVAAGGSAFEPMPGRPMKGYLCLPPKLVADASALAHWVARAIAHGRTLPVKGAKKPAPKSSSKKTAAKNLTKR